MTTPQVKARGEKAIKRMREEIAQRRIMTKPCFHDFDRHNYGYVSRNQFAQGLSYLGLESTESEREVSVNNTIVKFWGNSKFIQSGKCYALSTSRTV